jgi:hypothetical protein
MDKALIARKLKRTISAVESRKYTLRAKASPLSEAARREAEED